jgi:5'-methylthioadenosine phosphorylase
MKDVRTAIIGGSAAYSLLAEKAITGRRLGPRKTPFGPSQPIFLVRKGKTSFYFLSRHGEKGYSITAPFVNYRANIYALRDLGVRAVMAWSGPGALNGRFRVGQFVIPDDVIDETKRRPSTFFENKGIGFIRMHPTFCPTLRECLKEALIEIGGDFVDSGTYVCTEGPRLETRAEIRKYARAGGDLVGMTLAPEVFLARELEMCYVAVCYVTNYAEGVRPRRFKGGELFEGLLTAAEKRRLDMAVMLFPEIVSRFARIAATAKFDCDCRKSMERYRKRGDISYDWHDWVSK